MRIIFDAMGGDNAPDETLKGARLARDEYGVEITLVGDKPLLTERAAALSVDLAGLDIRHAPTQISMEDEPTAVLKEKGDCSMAEGLRMLKSGEGDAFVSAGNTGALVVGATMIAGRLKGIKRAALTTVIPSATGAYLLADVGANAECRPEMLVQFGVMGSAYMEKIMGIAAPKVGIANIGTEPHKGTPLQQETYRLMQDAPLHFIGNAEARDIPFGVADVVVCDGFTGNIILKLTEGLAKMMAGEVKKVMFKSPLTKLGALTMAGGMKGFKDKMDYSKYGGAPLLGLKAPVIKAHGSSGAEAFQNAIRQAKTMVENGVISTIETALGEMRQKAAEGGEA